MNRHDHRNDRGFARVHMMLATGVLSALLIGAGAWALYTQLDLENDNEWRTTVEELQLLNDLVLDYRSAHGQTPESLEDVTEGRTPVDPWGNPYVYERHNDSAFTVYSLGCDGQKDTIEDVHLNR